jgi:hypothetical protein
MVSLMIVDGRDARFVNTTTAIGGRYGQQFQMAIRCNGDI